MQYNDDHICVRLHLTSRNTCWLEPLPASLTAKHMYLPIEWWPTFWSTKENSLMRIPSFSLGVNVSFCKKRRTLEKMGRKGGKITSFLDNTIEWRPLNKRALLPWSIPSSTQGENLYCVQEVFCRCPRRYYFSLLHLEVIRSLWPLTLLLFTPLDPPSLPAFFSRQKSASCNRQRKTNEDLLKSRFFHNDLLSIDSKGIEYTSVFLL